MKRFCILGLAGVAVCAFLLQYLNPSSAVAEPLAKPAVASASVDSGLVAAQSSANVFVTVYGNRYAQIEETRRVHLEAGQNRILLEGIATQYRPDSLRVLDTRLARANVLNPQVAEQQLGKGKAFTYLSATYQPANLSLDKLLALSVGKQVSIVTANGDRHKGELLSVNGNMVVLRTASKTEVVSAVGASFEQVPEGVASTASLVVEAHADVAGDYDFHFMYETGGITWSASHSLIYNDEKSVVENWETTVSIVNNSGTSFKKATVSLLPGKVANGEVQDGRMYAAREAAPMAAGARETVVDSLGDQTTYTLAEKTTLVEGQSRQVPLFSAQNVPVKREYFVPASHHGWYSRGKQEVSIRLEVENCENNKLGKPLPAGPVKVYQHAGKKDQKVWNSANPLQLVGSASLAAKAVDEVFQMVIGTSSEIKWERVLVDRQEATAPGVKPNPAAPRVQQPGYQEVWEEHTYKVNVYNFKRDRDVEVTIELSYPSDQSIGQPWTLKEDISQAHTKVTVPKSGQGDVQYKVKERVR